MRWLKPFSIGLLALSGCCATPPRLQPCIAGPWWTVARNPDLGSLNGPPAGNTKIRQEPVDFAIWQAADGTWQLWSCIRGTNCGGVSRLLHGWEGKHLTDTNWTPTGVKMQAEAKLGETPGGLQAPYVFRENGTYYMFYGDWVNLCIARSQDGKTFERWLMPNGKAGMFSDGDQANTRDPMVVRDGKTWHCYYTAIHDNVGANYCRSSTDRRTWSEPKMVARGGRAGNGPWSAECPQVIHKAGYWYLFRTQQYSGPPTTRVYRSKDPMDFGIDSDDKLVCVLEVAAPEIFQHEGQWYIAALLPDVQGIRISKLTWVEDKN